MLSKDLFYLTLISFTLCSNKTSSKLGGSTFKPFPSYQTSVKKCMTRMRNMWKVGGIFASTLMCWVQAKQRTEI